MFAVIDHPAGYETFRFVRDGSQWLVMATTRVMGRVSQTNAVWDADKARAFQAAMLAQGYRGRDLGR